MARLSLPSLVAIVGLSWPILCAAESAPLRPGLWELSMQRDGVDASARQGAMQERMKNMSPEQRQKMESMMQQRGIDPSSGAVKLCMTKESFDSDAWHSQQQRETGCKTQTTRGSSTWKFHRSCPAPNASETDGEVTFVGDTKYSLRSTTRRSEDGQPKTSTVTATGTWLSADCKGIKPFVPNQK